MGASSRREPGAGKDCWVVAGAGALHEAANDADEVEGRPMVRLGSRRGLPVVGTWSRDQEI